MSWQRAGVIAGTIVSVLVVLGVLLTVGHRYMVWQITVTVQEEMAKLDIQTDSNIVAMKDDIQANSTTNDIQDVNIENNKENNEATDRRVEAMARILMSE